MSDSLLEKNFFIHRTTSKAAPFTLGFVVPERSACVSIDLSPELVQQITEFLKG